MNIRIAKKVLEKALNKEDIFTESFLNFYSKKGEVPVTFLNVFKNYFKGIGHLEDGTQIKIVEPKEVFKELQKFDIYKYLPNGKLLYLSKRQNKQKDVFSVFIFY